MILGVESSCDESALALFDPAKGLECSLIHSQLVLHREFGGVVPDLAAREHLEHFPRLFESLREKVDFASIDQVAVTRGPGLAGCLAIGIAAAKGFSLYHDCPLVGVNHLAGHAWSPFIPVHAEDPDSFEERLANLLPHLGLLVSGGNTILFRLERDRSIEILAETRDDAAGEALDKGAKLMGLPYPGGPEIERRAEGGDVSAFRFPRAFADPKERAFSFSGLKTSLRYRLEKMAPEEIRDSFGNLCASYQEAVVDALVRKMRQVLKSESGIRSLGLSGGVANNKALRERFSALAGKTRLPGLVAEPKVTGDNAAMIAFAAYANPGTVSLAGDRLGFEPSLPLTD
ncbi:tRNA (adenosine(37)-N6)-threonylcarbamoyltransferase complex transferase subunit TsaD [Puniceicoccus vermicola]|uniref:tRNA N6-adenosine threonylcarbamoyltransferase n=1 Tax=Puniceicoccus vermicola TaxID=388746 RepID=A0A7X1AVP0_9BACT|nr:tRNA (adenosine(37)-N6)-threonylcarbamoyltransferase complex transferase subunit TsaD [Puniceicoccus vermicola]MBC2600692.1 tRNA (adenosine(37)-N6)-threonylcarbamoyltransferase complex transferase subunit TsaD [Puniceicoccus vermicola]